MSGQADGEIDGVVRSLFENPLVVEVLISWMSDLEVVSFADGGALEELAEEAGIAGDIAVLVDRALLLGSTGWVDWLIVPESNWTWASDLRKQQAVVLARSGAVRTATIAELRADSAFWLRRGTCVGGVNDVRALPFRFDGDDWAGTTEDQAFGDTEWTLCLDGIDCAFDMTEVDIGFADKRRAISGMWLSIACDGESASTGEIGFDIFVTIDGALFTSSWGFQRTLVGHAGPGLGFAQLSAPLDPNDPTNTGLSEVLSVRSDVLGERPMRQMVRWLLEQTETENPDEVEVEFVGWSGTAAELLDVPPHRILDLAGARAGRSSSHLALSFVGGVLSTEGDAEPASPMVWVVSRPSTADRRTELVAAVRHCEQLEVPVTVLVLASDSTRDTALAIAQLALAGAGARVDFFDMKLVQSPSRTLVLFTPDEEERALEMLFGDGQLNLYSDLWIQTHLEIIRWPADRIRSYHEYEEVWFGPLHANWLRRGDDSFRWIPGVAIEWDGMYRLRPLSESIRRIGALTEDDLVDLDDVAGFNGLKLVLGGWLMALLLEDTDSKELVAELVKSVRAEAVAESLGPVEVLADRCRRDARRDLIGIGRDADPVLDELRDLAARGSELAGAHGHEWDRMRDRAWVMGRQLWSRYLSDREEAERRVHLRVLEGACYSIESLVHSFQDDVM